ncbi:MAG TPA: hypothetical protein VJM53_08020, partial [Burkholderiales bacterium]|nr:hypothetical protein [Burkholderiales bacterium]
KGRDMKPALKATAFATLLAFSTSSLAETWIPLSLATDSQLRITQGSALDFSGLFTDTDMTKQIRINKDGDLAERAGRVQRYLCAPMIFSSAHGFFPEAAEAEELAVQLKRHGYNLVRFHFLDAALMGAPDSTATDFGFSPTQIQKFRYLLHQLKANSIRWMIDAATSRYGAYGELGQTRFPSESNSLYDSHNLKLDVHYNAENAAHWRGLVDRMLDQPLLDGGHLLTDNGTVALTLLNELGMNYNLGKLETYPLELQARFLAEEGLSLPPLDMDKPTYGDDLTAQFQAERMQYFLTRTEIATASWMKDYLSTAQNVDGRIRPAYTGLTTAYNNGKSAQSYAARFKQSLVSAHAYYDHPEDNEETHTLEMTSSYAEALPYIGYFGLARNLNKPFIVDEHHHPYWSPYRRESGLAFPAYAAFQGWHGICRFANPVYLQYEADSDVNRRKSLQQFNVGLDPVARAGETLSALLFRRGDVKKATHRAPTMLRDDFLHNPWSGKTPAPFGFNRLALVTGLGSVKETYLPDSLRDVEPFELNERSLNGALVESEQNTLWENTLADLKQKQAQRGWPINSSDATNGRYVTDSGEIVLDAPAKTLRVRTGRTEATVFPNEAPMPLEVGNLRIDGADGGAMVAASSLQNGKALLDSTRILLTVATDARSSNAVFTTLSDGRVELTERGNMPVEIRAIRAQIRLKHNGSASGFKLYALSLGGERIAKLPLSTTVLPEGGFQFNIELDTASIRDASGNARVTTYFEIAKK